MLEPELRTDEGDTLNTVISRLRAAGFEPEPGSVDERGLSIVVRGNLCRLLIPRNPPHTIRELVQAIAFYLEDIGLPREVRMGGEAVVTRIGDQEVRIAPRETEGAWERLADDGFPETQYPLADRVRWHEQTLLAEQAHEEQQPPEEGP